MALGVDYYGYYSVKSREILVEIRGTSKNAL
jgi:hypothetical protein